MRMTMPVILAVPVSVTVLVHVMIMTAVVALSWTVAVRCAGGIHASQHARKVALQHINNYVRGAVARAMQ